MCKEKAPIYRLSRSKHQKLSIALQTSEKTSGPFLVYDTGVDFSFRNIFTNIGSFVKVYAPVRICNSLTCTSRGFRDYTGAETNKLCLVCLFTLV